jgi:hypothetical protein
LLSDKRIDPMIAATFPLLEARKALELLATGTVEGKIVLEDAPSDSTGDASGSGDAAGRWNGSHRTSA